MPSETFYCPHCKRQLTKSAQHYVQGEILESKSPFISLGEPPLYVTCPACGGRIDTMKMIKGEYDQLFKTGKREHLPKEQKKYDKAQTIISARVCGPMFLIPLAYGLISGAKIYWGFWGVISILVGMILIVWGYSTKVPKD
ncbi:hypothetical protein [Flavobacterium gawalongense]|uniref:Uncharacterized protein n=1 Tax=Flavobacterium gawalongense TaxID=2594432 RepID=A0ABY3CW88_9FLAO|nr:hypothetical protein [Flavobacterium gawalongense]TRX03224.1 hypothetical protein FNW33_05180 [Flavobacterium gawalongense]TRX09886.1 hypothetical protein FNW12_01870 [Flavobacterium gawalongense]